MCGFVAAAAAILLVDPLIWHSEPVEPASYVACDPGCISTETAALTAAVAAALLATLGILLRRVVGRARSSARPRSARA